MSGWPLEEMDQRFRDVIGREVYELTDAELKTIARDRGWFTVAEVEFEEIHEHLVKLRAQLPDDAVFITAVAMHMAGNFEPESRDDLITTARLAVVGPYPNGWPTTSAP